MTKRPAIFLDRDGVLNDVVWRDGKPASPRTPDELVIADGGLDLNSNTLIVGQVKSPGKNQAVFDVPGSYTSPTSTQLDPIIFHNGAVVIRAYFKPIL